MAREAQEMLLQALDAFCQRNVELAYTVPERDRVIDDLCNHLYAELASPTIGSQQEMRQAYSVLWNAYALERAASRVIRICEGVVFTVTGEMVSLDRDHAAMDSVC
jgi:phosphate transport system protein